MNLGHPDRTARLDALAAQFALGTLSPRARRRMARIARTDPAVAGAIAAWEERLATLAEAIPGITPPPRVWEGIRTRLGLSAPEPARAAAGTSWWSNLGLWRGLATAGFALALA